MGRQPAGAVEGPPGGSSKVLNQGAGSVATTLQRYLKQQRGFESVAEEVFLTLQVLADRLMAPWAAYLRTAVDLTPVQYNVLRILRGAGPDGLWLCEIAERLVTRNPDVTRLVDRLEKRGLVRRQTDSRDRRAVRVELSDAGRDLIAPLDEKAREILGGEVRVVPAAQLEVVRAQLAGLLDALAPER